MPCRVIFVTKTDIPSRSPRLPRCSFPSPIPLLLLLSTVSAIAFALLLSSLGMTMPMRHASTPPAGMHAGDEKNSGNQTLTSEPRPIQRRSNVVLFGEMGAGKSSLVNLIMGLDHDVAKTSSGASSCTLDAKPYDVTIQEREFRIFDTVGLNEPQSLKDPDCLIGAINKAYRLVRYLSETGGINLLVFCIRRGRITVNMQQNYVLFHDFLCHKKVPIALVVTHLEHEENMEDWWLYNASHFAECGIDTVGHACITAKREFGDRYHASRQAVHELLLAHGRGIGYTQDRVSWVTDLFQKLLDFVGFRPRLDSIKVRVRKLREYGLKEEEIAMLLVKITAVDEDLALVKSPVRPHVFNALLRVRRSTHG